MSGHLDEAWRQALPQLQRLVAGMGCAAASAEDVLQDVYLAACRGDCRDLSGDDLRRWLLKVAVNRCRLEHRLHQRFRRAVQGWLARRRQRSPSAGNDPQRADGEERAAVRRALDRLPAEQRAILVMRYFNDMDSKEIGRVLELNDSTVRSRLRAARMRLAGVLRQTNHDEH